MGASKQDKQLHCCNCFLESLLQSNWIEFKQDLIVGAHWAADCAMQWFNILGSIDYNYTFFQIEFIAAPNWWTGICICNIYEVYSSIDLTKSAQYVSRAEYTMVAKEKKCYNVVSTTLFRELLHSLIRRL